MYSAGLVTKNPNHSLKESNIYKNLKFWSQDFNSNFLTNALLLVILETFLCMRAVPHIAPRERPQAPDAELIKYSIL